MSLNFAKVKEDPFELPPLDDYDTNASIDGVVTITPSGTAVARGTAELQDTILFAEPPGTSAACADTNGNGVAGLTQMTISFRVERSGERVLATVVPHDGEIEGSGRYLATMTFDRPFGSYEVWLEVVPHTVRY
jgi:hypothetical protein